MLEAVASLAPFGELPKLLRDLEKPVDAGMSADPDKFKFRPKRIKHDGKVAYQCRICNFTKGSYHGALSHINTAHSGETYFCHKCSFSTPNKDSLKTHNCPGVKKE